MKKNIRKFSNIFFYKKNKIKLIYLLRKENMLKRIFLWMAMNVGIMIAIWIIISILQIFFWFSLDLNWNNYISIFIYSLIVWFTWSFISLALSRYMAKKAYKIELINSSNLNDYGLKENKIFELIEKLANENWIEMPEVWIYTSNDPNAFATWMTKNRSLIAFSTGLLHYMNDNEIEGVIAHEMSHILNWDMVTMTLLQWVLNTFIVFFARIVSNLISQRLNEGLSTIAYFVINIILQILFWIIASLILNKFSRYREFRADAWSANLVWKEKIISWLEVLKKIQNLSTEENWKFAIMKISNKASNWFMKIFSTHPDLDLRIDALRKL